MGSTAVLKPWRKVVNQHKGSFKVWKVLNILCLMTNAWLTSCLSVSRSTSWFVATSSALTRWRGWSCRRWWSGRRAPSSTCPASAPLCAPPSSASTPEPRPMLTSEIKFLFVWGSLSLWLWSLVESLKMPWLDVGCQIHQTCIVWGYNI